MERLIESQSEAIMMNKILLQKLVLDTYMRSRINPKVGGEFDELNQFEEFANSYFNVNAFSLTTFHMDKHLSISIDYYQVLLNKIVSYNRNNNIFQAIKKDANWEVYDWTKSYKTFDFLNESGFVKVFNNENLEIETQKKTELLNSKKLKWESKLVKWQAIVFWPLVLLSIAGFIMSIIALTRK